MPVTGARVRVPFGRERLVAVCVTPNPADPHGSPRPLSEVLDDHNVLGERLFELALWLARYYHHPLGEVLATLLPAAARRGAALTLPAEECWRLLEDDAAVPGAPRQQALLAWLRSAGGHASTRAIYVAGFSRALLRAVAARGLIVRGEQPAGAVPTGHAKTAGLALNPDQRQALDALQGELDGYSTALLDGITGSGKTEVYLQLIGEVRARGRQVLVLVPEIALTPQTVARFEARFAGVAALHSNLGDKARLNTWLECRAGQVGILIGTRSALFTPFADLGLIVVDEEHDSSFKQAEGLRYSARDLAVKRARDLDIPLLLGSATPSFESLHNARLGRYRHLRLRQRAGGAREPRFELLDVRGRPLTDGLSDDLLRRIDRHLADAGQVLVFLNRRGFAPGLLCPACRWSAECPACDMRMTLHRSPPVLICHHCGRRQAPPEQCPACGQGDLLAVGVGTQRAEAGLRQRFPEVPLYRIDRDSSRSQRRLEAQFEAIGRNEPALLVGTQMLAKGHHFPAVTLVAVINADGGFLSPDFRAPERTAQLIMQVAGRAGRAERPGTVCIQTHQPDSPLLRALVDDGYPRFAERELASREAAGLPPFRPMALLRAEATTGDAARDLLQRARDALAAQAPRGVEWLGPAPAPIARVADRWRWQLLLLADARRALHGALDGLVALLSASGSAGVRWSLDVDPYDTF